MESNQLINDTGLFIGQKLFEFSLAESFETITNLFQTIQQYREFANPDDAATWFDYVHQVFHILGFNTVKIAPRLIELLEMGSMQAPKALACIIGPHENFDQIIYGLEWESYLFYAARYHHTDWVILTNGLQFKVLNYSNDADTRKYFKCEFDEIVKTSKTDNFFTVYKIFSIINHGIVEKTWGKSSKEPKENNTQIESDFRVTRKEFWEQLIARSKQKTQILRNKVPISDKYIGVGAGKSGFAYNLAVDDHSAEVRLKIDRSDVNWNKKTFKTLLDNRIKIERDFGAPLIWDRLDNNKASLIRYKITDHGLQDKSRWPELQDKLVDAIIKFEQALNPYIKQIQ